MFELKNDPVERAEQLRLNDLARARSNRIGRLYAGGFRSDMVEVVKETIQNLEEELAEWKAMLEPVQDQE